MKKSIYNLTCATVFAINSMSVMANQEADTMLKCEIVAPTKVAATEAIELTFKLTNESKDNLAVLKWNTPLEGWFGSSFKVTRDGQWVTYQGAMVKRFRPSESDYAKIAPGESVNATVNMAEGYDMKQPGQYKLVFNGRLQDVQVSKPGSKLSSERKFTTLNCNELTVTVE